MNNSYILLEIRKLDRVININIIYKVKYIFVISYPIASYPLFNIPFFIYMFYNLVHTDNTLEAYIS